MTDVMSYEPSTETLRIGKREFDVLHLRSRSKAQVLNSINLAMSELRGREIVGAREIYRDTTIVIVPRLSLKMPDGVLRFPANGPLSARRERPVAPMIETVEKGHMALSSPIYLYALGGSCLVVGALFWLLSLISH